MKIARYSFILIIIIILFYLVPANIRLLWQPDETRYAEISREMLTEGDWIVPHFLGLHYLEKPIAGYWINSISQLILGDSNFSVRAGSIFSVFLTFLLVIWLTRNIWENQHIAFLAGIVFLTLLMVCGVGTYATLDAMILFWLAVSMCSFWISTKVKLTYQKVGSYLILGISCGIGVIIKGFIAIAIPVFSIIPWIIYKKSWKEIFLFSWLAILSCVLIILPWGLAINYQSVDFWYYFFWVEHIQRFFQSNAQHLAPIWFYLPCLLIGSLPWIVLLPGAIYHGYRNEDKQQDSLYLLSWVVMPLLFFSISKGKLLTYILPCFTPLSILIARYIFLKIEKENFFLLKINAVFNILFGLFGISIIWMLFPFGLTKYPLWENIEVNKFFYAVIAFLVWTLIGWFSLKNIRAYWWLIAFCPLGAIFLVENIIPDKVLYYKQPQLLVKIFRHSLENSRFILVNNIGIASGIAWELKRNDIIIYENKGELKYGIEHSNITEHYVSKEDFKNWLKKHRYQGSISLVISLSSSDNMKEITILQPDRIHLLGCIAYLEYDMLSPSVKL